MNGNTKIDSTDPQVILAQAILAQQKIFNRRLLWLFLLPFIVTVIIVVMFLALNQRLTDVGGVTKQLSIERYLVLDNNYAMAIDQYEQLEKSQESAPILARLALQLLFLRASESMGNHDSRVVDADSVD
jgi:hypothetical protein